MIKKITLTEDHLALINNIRFEKFVFDGTDLSNDSSNSIKRFGWGIDQYNLFGGTFVMEDVAAIIGKADKYIPGTEYDALGKQYPKELEDYMWELYQYIWDNMEYIISLVFWGALNDGLKAGTYKCKSEYKNWERID